MVQAQKSLNDAVARMVQLAKRKQAFDAYFVDAEVHRNQAYLFDAIVASVGNVPARFRKEAVDKWVEKQFEDGAELNLYQIARKYLETTMIQSCIARISKSLAQQINRIVQGMTLNVGHAEFVVKSLSVSKTRKNAQLTFLFNGKPVTRHLLWRDGGWYGLPPAYSDLFSFVKYDLSSTGY